MENCKLALPAFIYTSAALFLLFRGGERGKKPGLIDRAEAGSPRGETQRYINLKQSERQNVMKKPNQLIRGATPDQLRRVLDAPIPQTWKGGGPRPKGPCLASLCLGMAAPQKMTESSLEGGTAAGRQFRQAGLNKCQLEGNFDLRKFFLTVEGSFRGLKRRKPRQGSTDEFPAFRGGDLRELRSTGTAGRSLCGRKRARRPGDSASCVACLGSRSFPHALCLAQGRLGS